MNKRMMFSHLENVSGENIVADRCKGAHIHHLSVYGKSTQTMMTGKNLLKMPTGSASDYGVTVSAAEGEISISGTVTSSYLYCKISGDNIYLTQSATELSSLTSESVIVKSGETVTIRIFPTDIYIRFIYLLYADGTRKNSSNGIGNNNTWTITAEQDIVGVFLQWPNNEVLNYIIKAQIELGSTATEYEPYIGGYPMPSPYNPSPIVPSGGIPGIAPNIGEIPVTIRGKNFVNPEEVSKISYTALSGTKATRNGIVIDEPGTYTASAYFAKTGEYIYLLVLDENNVGVPDTNAYFITNATATRYTRIVESGQKLLLYDALANNTIEEAQQNFKDFRIQIEQGQTATTYEPYKEPQTVTIPMAGGLPGIPVPSGGNYTDDNGQQWICDEVVMRRDGTGKYIQRVKTVVFDGSENWSVYASVPNHYQVAVGDNKFINDAATVLVMSNYYPGAARYSSGALTYAAFSADGSRLRFRDNTITTFDNWVAQLGAWAESGNPLTAIYVLQNPVETALVDLLPAEYQRVEYLESNGTQYIDTGYIPSDKTSVKCKYTNVSNGTAGSGSVIFGCTSSRPAATNAGFGVLRIVGGTSSYLNRVAWGDMTTGSTIDISGHNALGVEYSLYYDKAQIYIDDDLVGTSATGNTKWGGSYPVYLFARNTQGTADMHSNARISEFECYDDDSLAIDLIPCYRKSDSKPGMYDTVSGNFLTNGDSEADFTVGPEMHGLYDIPLLKAHTYSGTTVINSDSNAGISAVVRCK